MARCLIILRAWALAALMAVAPIAALAQPPKPVYVTGSPTTGALAKASGPQSITTGDLSGDCVTAGTLSLSCTLPVGHIAAIGANTVIGNAGSSSAAPSALSLPSCSASTSALIWTLASGFGCHTITPGAGTVTSVGVASTYLTVTGSPVTSSGTINVDPPLCSSSTFGVCKVDGSTITASGGVISATGGGGGAMTLVGCTVTTSSQTSVSLSSISGSSTNLLILADIMSTATGTASSDGLYVKINSDTTAADYNSEYHYDLSNTVATGGVSGVSGNGGWIGNVSNSPSRSPNYPTKTRVEINNYSGTIFPKTASGQNGLPGPGTSNFIGNGGQIGIFTMWWTGTAAINALVFTLGSGSAFVTGSTICVYRY